MIIEKSELFSLKYQHLDFIIKCLIRRLSTNKTLTVERVPTKKHFLFIKFARTYEASFQITFVFVGQSNDNVSPSKPLYKGSILDILLWITWSWGSLGITKHSDSQGLGAVHIWRQWPRGGVRQKGALQYLTFDV